MAKPFPYQKKLILKRRKHALFISLYSLLGLGIIFSSLSWFSHADFLSIQNFSILGISNRETLAASSVAMNEVSGNYISFFSKRNIFLYPKDVIEQKILELPFVQSVEINRKNLTEVEITIEGREESARWCESTITELPRCFSVDENGYIFGTVATSTAFVYRGLISGEALGQQILSASKFKEIQFFVRELGRLGVSPVKAEFGESGYMTIFLLAGGKLIINTNDDLSQVLSNISSILADRTVAPSIPSFLEKLDYIKLDSGNKVVYKLK